MRSAALPGAPFRVRYAVMNTEHLKGAVALVWLTVHVPKAAAPGEYEGKVSVSLEGRDPVEVSLNVSVAGWTLPDPQAFRTVVNIYQSPSTLAALYRVKEWSEEHWRLIDKSFALLASFTRDQ